MKRRKIALYAGLACALMFSAGFSATYYVSVENTTGTADGTLASPYPTIKQAADKMQSGDTCLIMSGVYRETVIPKASGSSGDPLVFMAYNNQNVFISAGERIKNWSLDKGDVYKAAISWDLGMGRNQVFVDGALMYEARVPNVDAVPGSVVDGNCMRNAPTSYVPAGPMNPGFISAATEKGGGVLKVWVGTATGDSKAVPFFDSCRAANAPDDFLSGAMIHKTGGYWTSFTGTVAPGWGIESGGGLDGWMYVMVNAPNWEAGGGRIAFIGKRCLLDAQKEWVIEDGTIYFRPPGDKDPNTLYVEAKKRMLVVDLRGRNYVEFRGLNFLGGSVSMDRSNNCVFDKCHFRYVTHWTLHHGYQMKYRYNGESAFYIRGNNNKFINSSLEWSAASGIYIQGGSNLIDNCLIHDCDYLGTYDVGVAFGDTAASTANTLSHNTMYNFGRSAWTLSPGTPSGVMTVPQKVMYNDMSNCMFLVDDGGTVYLAGDNGGGTEIAYNWMYNMIQTWNGHHVYYDWGGGFHSIIHHNVFWQDSSWMSENNALTTAPMRHVVYNNTSLQSPWSDVYQPFDDDERGVNALWADSDYDGWGIKDYPNRDFTLVEGSKAIDKGTFRADSQYLYLWDYENYRSECYLIDTPVVIPASDVTGDAPDQGAYEFGLPRWVPGHDWGDVVWVYPPDGTSSVGLAALRAQRLPPQCQATATHLIVTMPDGAAFDVRVMDLAGRTVARHHVEAGRKTLAVPAQTLPATVVLVRVSSGDLNKTFRRWIVR